MSACLFAGCIKKPIARGLCHGHYRQQWKGEALRELEHRTLVRLDAANLAETVRRACVESDGCWVWTGAKDRDGYPQARVAGRMTRVTRALLGLENGSPLVAMHACDNPSCCNPAHLSVGTVADNNKDRSSKGRCARGSRGGNSKLTEADVERARSLHAAGETFKSIAARLGVSGSTISNAVRGETWRHVP